jgi:hypothetical protein
MKILLVALLSMTVCTLAMAELMPLQAGAKRNLEETVQMEEDPGSLFAQARFDGTDYRPILKRAIDLDLKALLSLFPLKFMGEAAETHGAVLKDLMQLWGDTRFAEALRSQPQNVRDLVIGSIDYAWAEPDWSAFPKTLAASPDRVSSDPWATASDEEVREQAEEAKKEETYIPIDLDDAVRQLNKQIRPEDKELIRKGEIDSGGMHLGLGMGLRNSWGLWHGSRLAEFFQQQRIMHPDSMSDIILDAFCRNLRGQKHDLLSIMREKAKQWQTFHVNAAGGGEGKEGNLQALLFRQLDYDEKKNVVATSLLWNPEDGKTYLESGTGRRLATEQEIKRFRETKEGWNYTLEEEEVLAGLRSATPEERLAVIRDMSEEDRWKFDKLLPRPKDPEGIDKEPVSPFEPTDPNLKEKEDTQPATGSDSK